MDREQFCAALLALIKQGVPVMVTVFFDMGEEEPYKRSMQLLDIKPADTGYECVIKGYGIALIPFRSLMVIQSP